MGLFSAIAYISVFVFRIPMVAFLSYEPKDIIITLGGVIMGPLSVIVISVVVSLIEMFTISTTGIVGFIMNVLATVGFALPVAILYKRKRQLNSALFGLIIGSVLMTILMIIWNILITPLYLQVDRESIIEMLVPVFLPFNIIKATVNSTMAFMLYKPLMYALKKSGFIKKSEENLHNKKTSPMTTILPIGLFILCVVSWIIWRIIQQK